MKLLTKREACERLAVSLSTLNYMLRERLLPHVIVGRHGVRITQGAIEAYIASNTITSHL